MTSVPTGAAMSNPPVTAASIGDALGRAVLAIGLFLLGFAGYQLWGTGLAEASAQEQLSDELAARLTGTSDRLVPPSEPTWLDQEPGVAGTDTADAQPDHAQPDDAALIVRSRPTVVAAPAPVSVSTAEPLAVGEPFARLHLPTIDVDKTVVEGTTREALRSGPGHYLGTARPGQAGNVAIAGHRTTYGAPFHDIDRLEPGDPIVVETEDGVFTYRVEAHELADGGWSGHRIVAPEAVEVIADQGDHRLTLTACHPRYSARQRIVVTAILETPAEPLDGPGHAAPPDAGTGPSSEAGSTAASGPVAAGPSLVTVSVRVPTPVVAADGPPSRAPAPPFATMADTGGDHDLGSNDDLVWDDGLGWQLSHAPASLGWAALSLLVVAAAWLVGRLWRRTPAYLMAGPSLALCLVTCFAHLDRLIPTT